MPVLPDGSSAANWRLRIPRSLGVPTASRRFMGNPRYVPPKPRLSIPPANRRYMGPIVKSYTPPRSPSTTSSSSSGGAGGISLPSTTNPTFSGGRSNAQLMALARQAVELEVNPQIKTMEAAYRQENVDYNHLIETLRKQLGLSKGDVKQLYDTLDVALQANAQKQGQINAQTKASLGASYDQLKSMIGSNYQGAQSRTTGELSRLGITDPHATQQMTADQQYLQGVASTNKTNAQSLLDAINASTQGTMTALRGSAGATSGMLQGQLQQEYDKQTSQAAQEHLKRAADIWLKRKILVSSRPGKINQTYAALLDQQYQREMDAAQAGFNNQIKLAQLGVSQASQQSTNTYHQNQLALEAQRIANSAAAQKAKGASQSGLEKSLGYLQNLTYVKQGHVPFDVMQQILIDAVNGDPSRPDYPGFNEKYMSQYANDLANAVHSRGLPGGVYTDLLNAMYKMFGK